MLNLIDLPPECLWHITRFMSIDDIALLALTCRDIKNALVTMLRKDEKEKVLKYAQAYLNLCNIVDDTLKQPTIRGQSGFCQHNTKIKWPKWSLSISLFTNTLTSCSEHVIIDTVHVIYNIFDIEDIDVVSNVFHRILKSNTAVRIEYVFKNSTTTSTGCSVIGFMDLEIPSFEYNSTYREVYLRRWNNPWNYYTVIRPFYTSPSIKNAHDEVKSFVEAHKVLFTKSYSSENKWLTSYPAQLIVPSLNMTFDLGSVMYCGEYYITIKNVYFYIPQNKAELSISLAQLFFEEMMLMMGINYACFYTDSNLFPFNWEIILRSNKYNPLFSYGNGFDHDESNVWYKKLM